MFESRDYDESDDESCPECIRVFCLALEVIASIALGVIGIIVYYKVYYSFDYPNVIFEQQIDTWNKEYITHFMFVRRETKCEDIGDQWNSYFEYRW